MISELKPIEKSAEARKIINPEYAAGIDDIVSIIYHNDDPFAIANNSFNYGYYQGFTAERAAYTDNLKQLYYSVIVKNLKQSDELTEVKESIDKINEWTKDSLTDDKCIELDELIGKVYTSYELQGFVYGAKYIMGLVASCGIKINE